MSTLSAGNVLPALTRALLGENPDIARSDENPFPGNSRESVITDTVRVKHRFPDKGNNCTETSQIKVGDSVLKQASIGERSYILLLHGKGRVAIVECMPETAGSYKLIRSPNDKNQSYVQAVSHKVDWLDRYQNIPRNELVELPIEAIGPGQIILRAE